MNKNNIITIAIPFIVLVLGMILAWKYKFKQDIHPLERQLQTFSYSRIQIVPPKEFAEVRSVKGPIIFNTPVTKFPQVPLSEAAPKPIEIDPIDGKSVSMVMINGDRKIAIINGIIVSEGGVVDGVKVERIEKDRVLIRSATRSKWIGLQ